MAETFGMVVSQSESEIEDIAVRIEIKSLNPTIRQRHTYVGGIVAHKLSTTEATLMGKCLTFTAQSTGLMMLLS